MAAASRSGSRRAARELRAGGRVGGLANGALERAAERLGYTGQLEAWIDQRDSELWSEAIEDVESD
jgi:hypothetical protein